MQEFARFCGVSILSKIIIKKISDMTAEEIAELEKMQTEAPAPTPTIEERMASIEEDTKVIRAILMGEETSE